MTAKQVIGYCRCSTRKQGESGLGLEAQAHDIETYCERHGYELLRIDTEVASGKLNRDRRPVLNGALTEAEKTGATVLVSKLCRLSRDMELVGHFLNTRAPFEVVQFGPHTDTLMIGVHVAMKQREREEISERIKGALAAKKARGEAVGNIENLAKSAHKGREVQHERACEEAEQFRALFERYIGQSFRAIARDLNEIGHKTARGGRWHPQQVSLAMNRLELI